MPTFQIRDGLAGFELALARALIASPGDRSDFVRKAGVLAARPSIPRALNEYAALRELLDQAKAFPPRPFDELPQPPSRTRSKKPTTNATTKKKTRAQTKSGR